MAVLQAVGVVVGLVVITLMALGPALVALNDRYPPRPAAPKARESYARPPLTRQAAPHH